MDNIYVLYLYEGAIKMIGQKKTGMKQAGAVKKDHIQKGTPVKKTFTAYDGTIMTIDPELDKFSGDEYLPEKHKEAERILANSKLPSFK